MASREKKKHEIHQIYVDWRIAGSLIEGISDEDFEDYVIQIICDYF